MIRADLSGRIDESCSRISKGHDHKLPNRSSYKELLMFISTFIQSLTPLFTQSFFDLTYSAI